MLTCVLSTSNGVVKEYKKPLSIALGDCERLLAFELVWRENHDIEDAMLYTYQYVTHKSIRV